MSNTTQENIQKTIIEQDIDPTSEAAEEMYEESTSPDKDPLEEIGDSLDLSAFNLNTISPEVFRRLSYWQKWSLRRQAGMFYYTATYAIYTFVGYVGFKMFYLVYAKNFRFKLDWWSLPLAIAVGLAFWFIHEGIFKKKLSDATKH